MSTNSAPAWKMPLGEVSSVLMYGTPTDQQRMLSDLCPRLVSTPDKPVPAPEVPPCSSFEAMAYETINGAPPGWFDLMKAAVAQPWIEAVFLAHHRGEAVPQHNLDMARGLHRGQVWNALEARRAHMLEHHGAMMRDAKLTVAGTLQELQSSKELDGEDQARLLDTTRLLKKIALADDSDYAEEAGRLVEGLEKLLVKMGLPVPEIPAALRP